MTYALWIVQGLLALLFLFSGGMKLVTPFDVLAEQMAYPLPEVFVRFIGLCEVAGALGLVLPGLLRIRPDLTALAAGGLVTIMLGAAMFTRPIRSSWSCFRLWWASWLASSQSAVGERLGPAGRHPERCCRRRADGDRSVRAVGARSGAGARLRRGGLRPCRLKGAHAHAFSNPS